MQSLARTMAAMAVAASAEHVFTPVVDQVHTVDNKLEMLLETFKKYNANLDFKGGF